MSTPAIRVTDLEMVILRAEIAGEDEVARRAARDQTVAAGQLTGLATLVHAALVIAAHRYFAPRWTRPDVIKFVAQIRVLLTERPDLLDPAAGETELRRALGEDLPPAPQAATVAAAQLVLLAALIASLSLNEAEVNGLLSEARNAADRMLAAIHDSA
jgi:hypothetical protein